VETAPAPPSATPSPNPSPPTTYEAESPANTRTGATVVACGGCSGGKKVGHLGRTTGSLRFNEVNAQAGGVTTLTIGYVCGDPVRTATLTVNDSAPVSLDFPGTGGWSTTGTLTVTVTLRPGTNTLTFSGAGAAPDLDKIAIGSR
jgi:hypothetical protein